MTKPASDRVRASRIRKKIAAGNAGPADVAWLNEYEGATVMEPPTGVIVEKSTPKNEPNESPKGARWVEVKEPPAPMPQGASFLSPSSPTTASGAPMVDGGPRCTIADCPACSGRGDTKGWPKRCATTGEDVWPPISDRSAEMIAGGILFVIGFAIKLVRGAEVITVPTKIQINLLAKAIKEVVRRRLGWVAMVDDYMQAGWALGAYVKDAATAPLKLPAETKKEAA